jgi:hypothetical protein
VPVEKRCQEIQLASQVFVESLKAAFSAHLMKFPKATRSMTTEEFFGEEVQQFSDVRSKAEFILMSACKPGRPPLTAARPTQPPASSTTLAQPAVASIPGSALRGARSQRAFETPRHAGKTGVTFGTPAGSSAAMETPGGLVSSVYVSKVR